MFDRSWNFSGSRIAIKQSSPPLDKYRKYIMRTEAVLKFYQYTYVLDAEIVNQRRSCCNVLKAICHLSDPGLLSENWQIGQRPVYTCPIQLLF